MTPHIFAGMDDASTAYLRSSLGPPGADLLAVSGGTALRPLFDTPGTQSKSGPAAAVSAPVGPRSPFRQPVFDASPLEERKLEREEKHDDEEKHGDDADEEKHGDDADEEKHGDDAPPRPSLKRRRVDNDGGPEWWEDAAVVWGPRMGGVRFVHYPDFPGHVYEVDDQDNWTRREGEWDGVFGQLHGDEGDVRTPKVHADGRIPEVHADGRAPHAHYDEGDGRTPRAYDDEADVRLPQLRSDVRIPRVRAHGRTPQVRADGRTPKVNADGRTPHVYCDEGDGRAPRAYYYEGNGRTPRVHSDVRTPHAYYEEGDGRTPRAYYARGDGRTPIARADGRSPNGNAVYRVPSAHADGGGLATGQQNESTGQNGGSELEKGLLDCLRASISARAGDDKTGDVKHFRNPLSGSEASDPVSVATFLRRVTEASDDLRIRVRIVQRHSPTSTFDIPLVGTGTYDDSMAANIWKEFVERSLTSVSATYVRDIELALIQPPRAAFRSKSLVGDYQKLRSSVSELFKTHKWVRTHLCPAYTGSVGMADIVHVDCLVRSLPPNLANAVASKFQGTPTTIDEVHRVVMWELQSPACAACGTKHGGSACPATPQPHTYRYGHAHAAHRRPATAVMAAVDGRQHCSDGSSPDLGAASPATEPGYLASGAQAGFGYAYPLAAAPAHSQTFLPPQPTSQQPIQPQPAMVAQPPQLYPTMAAGAQPQAFQPPPPPDGPPPGMCFSCKQSGHYARDCPAVLCYKCGQVGHISRSCSGGQSALPTGQGGFRRQGGRGCKRQGCNNEVHALGDCPNFEGCPFCGSKSHLGHSCPQNPQNRQSRSPGNGRR